jgi:transposase
MRDTFLRSITDDQRNILYGMIEWDDKESSYRAKIILLKEKGYTVPEIRKAINHHDTNIRKWIHRFNEKGIEGITSRKHMHKSLKITDKIEKKIVEAAAKNPREDYGLPFSTWSLRVLAGYISKEMSLVDKISHTEIRNILIKYGIRYRQSKTVLGNSLDPEYHLKKRGLKN